MVTYTTGTSVALTSQAPFGRGVPVGRVTDLRVDPRGNNVEIDFEVFVDRLNTIGMNASRIRQISDFRGVFPRLQARIVGNPVTGEAYLLLDVPQNSPPPIALGFTPNRPYVPSVPSMSATVQDRLPVLLDRAEATLQTLREIVTRMPASLDRSDRFFTNVERIVQESQLRGTGAALRGPDRGPATPVETKHDGFAFPHSMVRLLPSTRHDV